MKYSFQKVNREGTVISMWNPEVSGDYISDCKKGRAYAEEVIAAMRQEESPALLGWIIRGFGQDEARRGVEVGFCQAIAEAAMT